MVTPLKPAIPMPKIIFVCLGNICRSPLAEAIFIKKLGESDCYNLKDINVISAATSEWNLGDGADERAVKIAIKREYTSILDHQAKKLELDHLDTSEKCFIICMDQSNKQNVHKIIGASCNQSVQVHLFSDFGDESGREVDDPYYGGIEDFQRVLEQCEKYSDELLEYLINEL